MRHLLLAAALLATGARAASPPPYTDADFTRTPKFDAHVHANLANDQFLAIARRDGFQLLSINTDYPDFPPLPEQARIAERDRAAAPERFHYATTFSMAGFGTSGWTARTIAEIDRAVQHGAVAVKVWKNVGMVAKDAQGHRVFLDDPRFDGVMAHLEKIGLPLIAHQGEPRNCWLPLNEMSTDNDRSYFKTHPNYYMYLHPKEPSYEALMAARDRFVARHPHLVFIGAHLASLEWDTDVLARFLDRFPNASVDLAARMTQLQAQSVKNPAKVRTFFLRYQDRLLYGTDLTQERMEAGKIQNPPVQPNFEHEADAFWRSDWRYLATGGHQRIDAIHADVAGLALPRAVINKLYWLNPRRVFRLK